jgi:excisionase family DNA binding protein
MFSFDDSSVLSAQNVWQRHRNNGEPLVLAIRSEGLKSFNRATVLRWILAGKIPAIKIGRRFWTTQSLVDEWIVGGKAANSEPYQSASPPKAKPGPKPKKSAPDTHAQACENLRKKGLM